MDRDIGDQFLHTQTFAQQRCKIHNVQSQIVKKPAKKKKSHQKFEPSITKDTLKCRKKRGHEAKQNQGFYFFSSNT